QSTLDRREGQSLFCQRYRQKMFFINKRGLLSGSNILALLEEKLRTADEALADSFAIFGAPSQMAVMALGRLGSREFDLLSDADVIFVADEAEDAEECRRAAERVVEFLTAYTREGTVFPVDARLRPQGNAGELVTTPTRLA